MFEVLSENAELIRSATGADIDRQCVRDERSGPGEEGFRTLKVLVVDTAGGPVPVIEHCLRHMRRFECFITRAGTQAAAAFAVSAETFDVIITDAAGLAVLSSFETTPAIVVTDLVDASIRRKTQAAGALDCLKRDSLSPRVLEAAIGEALGGV